MTDPTKDSVNGASVQASTDRASSGSRSLKVNLQAVLGASYAEIGTQFCPGGFDSYNYVLNFDLYSANYTGWVVAMAWNASTGQWTSVSSLYLTAGVWQTYNATFGTDNYGAHVNTTNIGIYVSYDGASLPTNTFVYVDNIYITQ
jgi:hypothetical protein